jgi:hypothetical protein
MGRAMRCGRTPGTRESSVRFGPSAAVATSGARCPSVHERSPSPMARAGLPRAFVHGPLYNCGSYAKPADCRCRPRRPHGRPAKPMRPRNSEESACLPLPPGGGRHTAGRNGAPPLRAAPRRGKRAGANPPTDESHSPIAFHDGTQRVPDAGARHIAAAPPSVPLPHAKREWDATETGVVAHALEQLDREQPFDLSLVAHPMPPRAGCHYARPECGCVAPGTAGGPRPPCGPGRLRRSGPRTRTRVLDPGRRGSDRDRNFVSRPGRDPG